MMKYRALAVAAALMAGCASETAQTEEFATTKADPLKGDSSAEAVFVNFTFDGELYTGSAWNAERQIEDQLLYTIGHLNGDRAVGRLDRVELSNIEREPAGDLTRVSYTATLPVAWGSQNPPQSYTLKLPRRADYTGFEAFSEAYSHDCVDWGAHDVDSGSMWYYYRPNASRCNLAASDIVEVEADVTPSASQTTGRFPEYDRVWADDVFRVVAIFGKYEDGATTGDAGISAYATFVREVQRRLSAHQLETTPAQLPSSAGVATPDIEFRATLAGGREVQVVTLLVDNVRTAGQDFTRRYEALSGNADLIVYNGHAGLGANIRALAQKGRWVAGQYAIVFMNGCDTYAYVDDALWDARAQVNPDDPAGTKYLDIITNALPSYFRSMARATLALMDGLIAFDEPQTYEQIFAQIDSSQVVLVSGEEDNTYQPGEPGEPTTDEWTFLESGRVARNEEHRFVSPTLPAGEYTIGLEGDNDADLYVRIGSEPTERLYECRPFIGGSRETCVVSLSAPAELHVMVRGWAQSSSYTVSRRQE